MTTLQIILAIIISLSAIAAGMWFLAAWIACCFLHDDLREDAE